MNQERHTSVAIIGSGFGGIAASIALARAGIDHVVFERADEIGGTWRDNRYPGCRCDVPAHLYSFSFAPNPDWTYAYSTQSEILDYLRGVASRFDVTSRVLFGHDVTSAAWHEERQLWLLDTEHGQWTAGALIAANGALAEPSLPDIPGLDRFGGEIFHSAAWNPNGALDGRRLAIIGTGASAVQIVPEVQPRVASLYVFQRTPAWVLPHLDRPIPAWRRRLYRRLPVLQRLVRWGLYWSHELLVVGFCKDIRLVNPIRHLAVRHLLRQVAGSDLRARLMPTFAPGCKRLLLSNDYYPALTRPNVELVTERIARLEPRVIVTSDGRHRDVDVIVMATGFRVTDNPIAERLFGRAGRSLASVWEATGAQAYLGTTVAGFPNLFLLTGPNTGIGHTSLVVMIEAQVRYVVGALQELARRRAAALEVRPQAQQAFNSDLQRRMRRTVWNAGGCASWYLDRDGRNTTIWPDFTWKFVLRTRRFDAAAYRFDAPLEAGRRDIRPASAA